MSLENWVVPPTTVPGSREFDLNIFFLYLNLYNFFPSSFSYHTRDSIVFIFIFIFFYKWLFGHSKAVRFEWTLEFTYGGDYKGVGKYLDDITISPTKVIFFL